LIEWVRYGLFGIAMIALAVATWAQIRTERHIRDTGHSLFSFRGMWVGVKSDAFLVQLIAVLVLFVSGFLFIGISLWERGWISERERNPGGHGDAYSYSAVAGWSGAQSGPVSPLAICRGFRFAPSGLRLLAGFDGDITSMISHGAEVEVDPQDSRISILW
jgi:hypothetical protein